MAKSQNFTLACFVPTQSSVHLHVLFLEGQRGIWGLLLREQPLNDQEGGQIFVPAGFFTNNFETRFFFCVTEARLFISKIALTITVKVVVPKFFFSNRARLFCSFRTWAKIFFFQKNPSCAPPPQSFNGHSLISCNRPHD